MTLGAIRHAVRVMARLATRAAIVCVMLVIVGQTLDRFVTSSLAASRARIPMAPLDALDLAAPIAATPPPPPYVMTTRLRRHEGVDDALNRLKVAGGSSLGRMLRQDGPARALRGLQAGDEVHIRYDDQRVLTSLSAGLTDRRRADGKREVAVTRNARGRLVASDAFVPREFYWRFRSGVVGNGFFSSMSAADVPGQVVAETMRIFRGEIDFRRDVRPGDAFHLIYQQAIDASGAAGVGRVLAIALQTGGKWHRAVWYEPSTEKGRAEKGQGPVDGGYYTFDGGRVGGSVWMPPVDNARISSPFGMRRHPLGGQRRRHDGIDLAAPTGTPVRASASGIVASAGWQRGYGHVVVLRHTAPYSTYYAHLNHIAPHIKAGARVKQGQRLGAVGKSGHSTGAHLHFEVRTGNRPIDPMVALLDNRPLLAETQRAAFHTASAPLVEQIARMQAATITAREREAT